MKNTFICIVWLRLVDKFIVALFCGHRPARSGDMKSARLPILMPIKSHNGSTKDDTSQMCNPVRRQHGKMRNACEPNYVIEVQHVATRTLLLKSFKPRLVG